jgi:hypothetical protein
LRRLATLHWRSNHQLGRGRDGCETGTEMHGYVFTMAASKQQTVRIRSEMVSLIVRAVLPFLMLLDTSSWRERVTLWDTACQLRQHVNTTTATIRDTALRTMAELNTSHHPDMQLMRTSFLRRAIVRSELPERA